MSPDGIRKIVDKAEKWSSFLTLARNTAQLAREVVRELVGPGILMERSYAEVLKRLNEAKIPLVPQF